MLTTKSLQARRQSDDRRQTVLAGNDKLLLERTIAHEQLDTPDTVVYIVVEEVLAATPSSAVTPKKG